jgi:hypothetical protein
VTLPLEGFGIGNQKKLLARMTSDLTGGLPAADLDTLPLFV